MATPVNTLYQQELYQEFERHVPATWFRKLSRQEGSLYPLVWGLCGALAGVRESIEAARGQALPIESEGFWLSLHLLGLGLTRRSGESDAAGRNRYKFEFSPTRNTRDGLRRQLEAHTGLSADQIQLETNFSGGRYGELSLVIEAPAPWTDIDWWWLKPFFDEWVANGLSRKATISLDGLRTFALRPWDFYTRFPMGADLLEPFWNRPAFLSELRIFEFNRQVEARSRVTGLEGTWRPGTSANNYQLPSANAYLLPVVITPIPLLPSALTDIPVSRNVLGFICVDDWAVEALRIAEIWRNLTTTQQPGRAFLFLGDAALGCQALVVPVVEVAAIPLPFPNSEPLEIAGFGPWRLRLGQGMPTATTIANPVQTLESSGEWWLSPTGNRLQAPEIDGGGRARCQVEFMLPSRADSFWIREIELTIGYEQANYGVGDLGWSLPNASAWILPLPGLFATILNPDPLILTLTLPTLFPVHYRRVDILLPADTNLGLIFDLAFPGSPVNTDQFAPPIWLVI
jgi:hypothetical protein